jgi:hypothetical protein
LNNDIEDKSSETHPKKRRNSNSEITESDFMPRKY